MHVKYALMKDENTVRCLNEAVFNITSHKLKTVVYICQHIIIFHSAPPPLLSLMSSQLPFCQPPIYIRQLVTHK